MGLQAELIGASSMQIACKTAKLFICLGGPFQLKHTIVLSNIVSRGTTGGRMVYKISLQFTDLYHIYI